MDEFKDLVVTVGTTWDRLDVAGDFYAIGLSYRYRMTYDLTLLGEFISMDNSVVEIKTRGFYVQTNYDLSERLWEGVRWNLFFETHDSDLLAIDLEEGLDYRFAGTCFQESTGLVYAYHRKVDVVVSRQVSVGRRGAM